MPVVEWSFEFGSVKLCNNALFALEMGTGWSRGHGAALQGQEVNVL